MRTVLGISAFQRDSCAVLFRDGRVVAAAQEDRFTRRRADAAFPRRAVRFCLREAGVAAAELDCVAYAEKPMRRFERLLASQMRAFPRSARSFSRVMFQWLGDRLWIKSAIADELGISTDKVLFVERHLAQAAGTAYSAPFPECAVLVVDGDGEWAATTLGRWAGGRLEVLKEIRFPHSLGLLYSACTELLGFEAAADEPKLAELAAYGTPRLREQFRSVLREDHGTYALDLEPFRFWFDSERLLDPAAAERRIAPARQPAAPLRYQDPDTRDADLAASLRRSVEDALLALAAELHRLAPSEHLCFAGVFTLQPALLARLLAEGPFRQVHALPAPGDAVGALGAAWYAHHSFGEPLPPSGLPHLFLGSGVLEEPGKEARTLAGEGEGIEALVAHLCQGRLVGWVRGAHEWGQRALGRRVLLADPRSPEVRERVNTGVKRREAFRPFACAVPAERAAEFFQLPAGGEALLRHKLLAVPVLPSARAAAPAVVHVDGTAVPQLVDAASDPALHRVLTRFGQASGVPILLSTSLDLRGDPAVRTEQEALVLFERSSLDALLVENRLYERA